MDRTSTGVARSPPRRRAGPLAPLRALSRRTAPPLLVYLVAGASGFASIAETFFWVRERLGLPAADLLALSAWLTVPWCNSAAAGAPYRRPGGTEAGPSAWGSV